MDAFGRAPDAQRSEELVRVERRRAEDLGQPPRRDAPVHLHLPQAVLRMRVTEPERGVLLARGDDVRDAVRVALDAHRLLQQRHANRAFVRRLAGLPEPQDERDAADDGQARGRNR